MKLWIQSVASRKPGYGGSCLPSQGEVEVGRSEVQSHLHLHSEFKVILFQASKQIKTKASKHQNQTKPK